MKKHRKKGKPPKAPHKRLQELPPMTISRADLDLTADTDPLSKEHHSIAADIQVCEATTAILSALQDEGIADPEEVRDVIHDYKALAKQYQEMYRKYEAPAKLERNGSTYRCPECHRQIHGSPAHCSNCGKMLGF